MEKIVAKLAGFGVPGLILITAMSATGLAGAAALTATLAALGPGGMLGGIATLGVIGLASEALAEFGLSAIFTAVVKELIRRGESVEGIRVKISRYPVTKSLKRRLYAELDKV